MASGVPALNALLVIFLSIGPLAILFFVNIPSAGASLKSISLIPMPGTKASLDAS